MNRKTLAALAAIALLGFPLLASGQDFVFPLPRPADRVPPAAQREQPAAPLEGEEEPALTVAPVDTASDAAAAAAAVVAEPQPVVLSAKITDESPVLTEGVSWRVFEAKADANGDLALAAKSEDALARLALVPGQYVVHVAYGRAQTTDTLDIEPSGGTDKSIILDAGGIRLNAAITGDVSIPINLLRFDIFSSSTESDRTLVASGLSANDIVTLNAGTYHVVSYFGDVNAVVRADLRVEPGELTDATLYHRAAQVSFKLVTQAGGEAIADVEWTVKTAAGETVFSNIGAFPATVLGEGEYLVLAKQGETVYSREFSVQPGQAREIEVLTTVY